MPKPNKKNDTAKPAANPKAKKGYGPKADGFATPKRFKPTGASKSGPAPTKPEPTGYKGKRTFGEGAPPRSDDAAPREGFKPRAGGYQPREGAPARPNDRDRDAGGPPARPNYRDRNTSGPPSEGGPTRPNYRDRNASGPPREGGPARPYRERPAAGGGADRPQYQDRNAERPPRRNDYRDRDAGPAPRPSAPARGGYKSRESGSSDDRPAPRSAPRERSAEPRKRAAKPRAETAFVPPVDVYEEPEAMPSFAELGLSEQIVRAITELGFESPTPIQARAIPVLLSGRDLIGQAQTGTGKTAAFSLPIIERIDPSKMETQALILAPTRELAVQVAGGIWDLAKHTGLRVVPVYGGQPIDRQFRSLKGGAQIVVGTPGRVLDHLRRGSLSLANLAFCTLDEADEMMALGFAEDMEAILAQLPEQRQVACFSATMPPRILAMTQKFLRDPVHVSIEAKQRTLETTNQTYYEVPKGGKLEALARVLDMESPGPTIVFCRTRQDTRDLSDALAIRGYNAEAIHGDMGQAERDRVMRRFREGLCDLLVATDVAARGLDIETVTHVVNYDIPWDVEQYIHRIGRTGRAGRSGDAITLVEGRQRRQLEVIERMIGAKIKPARIPTAADIASKRRDAFRDALRDAIEAGAFEGQLPTVETLSEEFDPREVAAAALHMLWQSQHSETPVAAEVMDADFEQPETGMSRIFIGIGREGGIRPGDIVGAITGEAGLTGKMIGVIDILDDCSFVEVPSGEATKVVEALLNTNMRGRKVRVQLARPSGEPEGRPLDKPKRKPRA